MRRSLFGLLTVLALASLIITTGCQRSNVLRVVGLNQGRQLQSDIADWFMWVDETLPDSEQENIPGYVYQPDSAEVELQYVEIGAGLPTWTTYEAMIEKATINYKSADPAVAYDPAVITLSVAVMADREGKKTKKFTMVVVPAWWKEKMFGDDVSEPPDYDLIDCIDATIRFSGFDSLAGRAVEASGKLQIQVGNLYDDEMSVGK